MALKLLNLFNKLRARTARWCHADREAHKARPHTWVTARFLSAGSVP